jgi:hypothetical protein
MEFSLQCSSGHLLPTPCFPSTSPKDPVLKNDALPVFLTHPTVASLNSKCSQSLSSVAAAFKYVLELWKTLAQ